jgi:hypothetical protein
VEDTVDFGVTQLIYNHLVVDYPWRIRGATVFPESVAMARVSMIINCATPRPDVGQVRLYELGPLTAM